MLPRHRVLVRVAMLVVVLLVVAACGGGSDRPTATPTFGGSPLPVDSTPPGQTISPDAIGTPFNAPWPVGWDSSFCAIFAEVIVMQELAVDVGRALDDDAREDARGLNRELAATAGSVREELAELPPWQAGAPLENQLVALLDLADRMAARYERYFEVNRRNPLNAARNAGGEMNDVVPDLLDRLTALEDAGLSCPGLEFSLETPPRP